MAKEGILIIAHGSGNKKWVQFIEDVVRSIESPHPIEIGYLELVQGKSIADGVKKLNHLAVEQIKVIPLFVCSGSTHLEEIQYALGLKEHSRIPTDLARIESEAEITWLSPLDQHPFVLRILEERVNQLAYFPENEHLLFVAHGSEVDGFHEEWETFLQGVCSHIQQKFSFLSTSYATLHPDNVREKAEALSKTADLIIVPLFLSEGYFTTKLIPKKLMGIQYRYEGQTLLPHSLVRDWIEEGILA